MMYSISGVYRGSERGPVIYQKYACLINFLIRHAFEHVTLHNLWKLEPSPCFTTCQLLTSACLLDDVIRTE